MNGFVNVIEYIQARPFMAGILSLILEFAMMPAVLRIAKEKHFVVKPNKRTSHEGEIPNIGGTGICFAFLLSYLLFEYDSLLESQFLLIGCFIIMLVGFLDDIIDLTPLQKIIGEVVAGGSLIVMANIRLSHLHGFCGVGELPIVWSYLLSFFVMIVIINALNLIDGVDGLASGLGIIYCLFFAIFFQLVGAWQWATLGYSMIGALMVFFIYNVFGHSKRKIFMGDSGSLLLGFLMTSFVFKFCELIAYKEVPELYQWQAAPAVAICVLSIPLFDTLRVMGTRIKHKQSPFSPDRNHIHHLLLRAGLTHLETTGVILAISLAFIGLAVLGCNWPIWLLVLVDFALCMLVTWVLWRLVEKKIKKDAANPQPVEKRRKKKHKNKKEVV